MSTPRVLTQVQPTGGPGRHIIVVDLTRPGGVSTILTYRICVR